MRDHRKLRAFELANEAVLMVYRATKDFPKDERFGLAAQMRRSAVSAVSNIVEGCARYSQSDYLRFLDIAFGSSCELQYQISLAVQLGYIGGTQGRELINLSLESSKVLFCLIRSCRKQIP